MAEENEKNEEEEGGKKKGGKLGLIIMLVAILLAAGGGFAVYKMVIAPKFADEEMPAEPEEPTNPIPLNPINYEFAMSTVNLMRDSDGESGILLYQVSFECNDDLTQTTVDNYKPRFVNMINKLHASRTRDEVDDILQFQLSVQRQMKQRANDMLKELTPQDYEGPPMMVTGVYHISCMATDAP